MGRMDIIWYDVLLMLTCDANTANMYSYSVEGKTRTEPESRAWYFPNAG